MTEEVKKEPEKAPEKNKKLFDKILFLIFIILIAIFIGKYLTQDSSETEINTNTEQITDSSQRDSLRLIDETINGRELQADAIHHKGCEQCFPTENSLGYLNQKGFDLIIDEDYYETSEEYKKLVEELEITKLPTVILSGNLDGLDELLPQFERRGEYLVLEAPQPPYYYVPTGKIIGYVEVTYLKDPECLICPKIGQLLIDMQYKMGVGFEKKTAIYPNMTEFKELTEKYNITKVPTFIFKGDLLEYENIKKYWDKVGSIEKDGALVLRLVNPPYLNPKTGEIEGIVDVTFLSEDAEAVVLAKTAEELKSKYKIVYGKSKSFSLSSVEGKKLIEKYNLGEGSAIILSKNAQLYPGLMSELNQTGIYTAEDGSLILKGSDWVY